MKLTYVFQISKSMLPTKNGINTTNICIQAFTEIFRSYGGKCLKRILTYLCSTNYNEISMYHLYIHQNVFYKKWHKYYKYVVYWVTQKFFDPMREIFKAYFIIFISH